MWPSVTHLFSRPFTLSVLLLLVGLADPARAGAWMRESGSGFASFSHYATEPLADRTSHYSALYLEYGVAPRLTLGLDLGRAVAGETKAIAFARLPLGSHQSNHRFAVELGLGQIAGQPTLRPGLSYGRGFSHPWGSGWFAVDSYAEFTRQQQRPDLKSDVTLGFNLERGRRVMLQLQAGKADGEPVFLRLVPSATFPIAKGWQLELGVSKALTGGREKGVKVGIWRSF